MISGVVGAALGLDEGSSEAVTVGEDVGAAGVQHLQLLVCGVRYVVHGEAPGLDDLVCFGTFNLVLST